MARTVAARRPTRRAPGEGSVSWNNYHGYWEGYVVVGVKLKDGGEVPDRRYRRSRTPGRPGLLEVEAALRAATDGAAVEREAELAAADPGNYTLWQAVMDWHGWVVTQRTSQQTADKLLGQTEKWAKAAIGGTPLGEVDVALLSNFLEGIAGQLGESSLDDILGTIRRAISYAMREKARTGFAGPNPANDVVKPRAGNTPREKDFLTKEQAEDVLKQAEGTPMHALMMIGFMLGLRPGEIRALKWEHVDLDGGVLYVLKWARKDGDGKTKTRDSRRAIRMPKRLTLALAAHKEIWGGHDYVFTLPDGSQLGKDNLKWRVGRVFRAAGHDLDDAYVMRHTFASIAYHEDTPARDIAKMMGHANEVTFKRVYAHWLDPEVTETADLMDGIWGS